MSDERNQVTEQSLPLVSVVVIGRNEGERLKRCLDSVFAMERVDFATEVIYVDSGSSDGSVSLAESMGARTITLHPERPSAALGRNAGWRAAKGTIVLFLDGDTVLHQRFVADSLQDFADQGTAVVWGHRRELYPERSIYIRTLDLDWIYAAGPTLYCGGDALFRREVLARVDGFDDTLIAGEEPELCRRIAALGYTIQHVDRPMTGHDLAIYRWRQYWKRSSRAGHAFAEVSERFRGTVQSFWTEESRRNRNRAIALMGLGVFGITFAAVFRSWWPMIAALLLFGLLALRSAWKARWKTKDLLALSAYGVHSHIQQIPIFFGQLQFWLNHRKGKRAMLVEYKQP
jgi:glycosyltransferase involved in cell wall biosynthesis